MRKTQHLIVGGGMTADAACKGIRDFDPDGSITVVGDEPHPPYARPPLSKALWNGGEESTIWRGTADLGVELRLGRTVVGLDLDARRATDDRGETYAYERLLLATGGRPRVIDGRHFPGVERDRQVGDLHRTPPEAPVHTAIGIVATYLLTWPARLSRGAFGSSASAVMYRVERLGRHVSGRVPRPPSGGEQTHRGISVPRA